MVNSAGCDDSPVVGVIVCAAGGALDVADALVDPLRAAGWLAGITLTPTAATWFTEETRANLEHRAGLPVRHRPRLPHQPSPHPPFRCVVVAPATANFVAKLATGTADTQAATTACEAIGAPTPVLVVPRSTAARAKHPTWAPHITLLRSAGVEFMGDTENRAHLDDTQAPPDRTTPWAHIIDWVLTH